jgi:poly-beta-1,6-N-acetyl-D-glucosamine biosynthesis protein PgaD
MTDAVRPWPPLIVADNIPRAVRWRDTLLTLLAWVAFAVFLDVEFKLSLASLRALETGRAHLMPDVLPDLQRLTPFFMAGAALAAVLFVRSARTLYRRSRALSLPQPAPLAVADEARAAGLPEADLLAAREQRIVVVHDDEGGLRIEAKSQS